MSYYLMPVKTEKIRSIILITFICILLSLNIAVANQNDSCTEIRTIFEIGSGSVKAKKAKVNTCKSIVIKTLSQASKVLLLQEQLDKSDDKSTLSKNTINTLVKTIDTLQQKLNVNCKKLQCVAIGTAALRKAKNSSKLLNILKKQLNVQGFIISQAEEGNLGYLSTIANIHDKSVNAKNIMVLDMGGGSTQLIYNTQHLTKTVNAQIGSQNFKSMVIEYVKDYRITEVTTPNPLTKQETQQTKELANKVIGELFLSSPSIRYILKTNKNLRVIGIGNLLNKMIPSIFNQKKMDSIQLSAIDNEINKLIFKGDFFIQSNYKRVYPSYVSEVVTDLILVHSIMKNLQLNKIQIMDIDNNDGILISNEYWH